MKTMLAGLALAFVALAACGGGASDDEQIRRVTNDFADAYNRNDASAGYKTLSNGDRESCSEADFATFLQEARAQNGNDRLTVKSVTGVTVSGNEATANVTSTIGDEAEDTTETDYVKDNGKWKLAGFC